MAYVNKLDTNIVTVSVTPPATIVYTPSAGTVELNDVIAYFTFIKPDATASTYTALIMAGGQVIVDETYATIDALINP
jgi:hypothetical protein